jgi:hypothetical protein
MASVNSKKHRNDQELTKDDFTAQGDDDATDTLAYHAQPFVRASAEVMATRRIVRAHRVSATDASASGPQNPFAKVSLVPAAPPTAEWKDTAALKEKDSTEETKAAAVETEDESAPANESSTIVDENDKTKEDVTTKESSAKDTEVAPKKPFVFGSAAPFSGFGAVLPGNGFGSSTSTGGFGSSTGGFGGSTASGFGNGFSSFSALGSSGSGSFFAKKSRTEETEVDDISNDKDDSNTPPVAILPEHYELKSGEEDYECLLELRCRTWKLSSASSNDASTTNDIDQKGNPSVPPTSSSVPPSTTSLNDAAKEGSSAKDEEEGTKKWVEVGIGPLRILRGCLPETSSTTVVAPSSCRIVQRRESSKGGSATNLILNLRPAAITMQATASEVHVQLVTVTAAQKAETHLFKFKLASEAQQFKDVLSSIVAEVEPVSSGEEPKS